MSLLLRVATGRLPLCRHLMRRIDRTTCQAPWARKLIRPSSNRPVPSLGSLSPARRDSRSFAPLSTAAQDFCSGSPALQRWQVAAMASSARQVAVTAAPAGDATSPAPAEQAAAALPAAREPSAGAAAAEDAAHSKPISRKQRSASPHPQTSSHIQGQSGCAEDGRMKLGKRKVALHVAYIGTAFRGRIMHTVLC